MANEHRSNPIPAQHACGVPYGQCRGQRIHMSSGLKSTGQTQAHSTPQSAYTCHKAYLVTQGYVIRDSRTLTAPDGSVRVLTKPSRFGAKLRGGKGTRWVPQARRKEQGRRGGHVVSL